MSILQSLKLLDKPLSELALLPQETIMQMAQNGQIPTEYVAPILGEKAQQAKAGANAAAMMAGEQMPTATVLEDLLVQNANAETQAAMPQMPQMGQPAPMALPEDMGIGALPINDQAMPEYANGGIVAFAAGDQVQSTPSFSSMYSDLGREAEAIQAARDQYLGPNQSVQDLMNYYQEAEKRAQERAAKSAGMRLFEAGLGIMGGESPYAFTNIGKGSQPALKAYGEDVAREAEAAEARKKGMVEAKGLTRAEKEKTFSEALKGRQAAFEAQQREATAAADRASRERVAAMPGEKERVAKQIQADAAKVGGTISMEEALRRATNALTSPPDRYNALSNRLTKANTEFGTRSFHLYNQLNMAKTDKDREAIQKKIDDLRTAILNEFSISPADLAELQATGRSPSPAPAPGATGDQTSRFSVTAPDGQTFSFPTKQKADEFRRKIQGQ